MRILSILLVVALSLVFATMPAQAEESTITVTGEADIIAKPDVAYVTLYVKADGILMVDAVKRADDKVAEIKAAILDKIKDVQSFEVNDIAVGERQREYWRSDIKDETQRPEVIRRIRIALSPNPQVVYELIDIAIRTGALMQIPSNVRYSEDIRSVVVYGLVKSAGPEDQARQKAIANAKEKAQKTAALVEKSIGEVVKIGCSKYESWDIPIRIMGREADFATEHVGTNPNEITISYAVRITFELE